ncbi:unnamed protein product [Gordionus sp. m RMFG-2023]|uniref:mitochondrial import receptor subunit TOM22 homolog n=1 Tax=Gordionus sp. m RMFG-2023 TaxID=3053472 RepID=UPI0030E0C926
MASTEESEFLNLDQGDFGFPAIKFNDENKDTSKIMSIFNPSDNLTKEEDDIDLDETLTERLLGLTEMFPEKLRTTVSYGLKNLSSTSKVLFHLTRQGLWLIFSSATILVVPLSIETMRTHMEQDIIKQQQTVLLGPNAHISNLPLHLPSIPPNIS